MHDDPLFVRFNDSEAFTKFCQVLRETGVAFTTVQDSGPTEAWETVQLQVEKLEDLPEPMQRLLLEFRRDLKILRITYIMKPRRG